MVAVSKIRDLVREYVGDQIPLKSFSERFESLQSDAVSEDDSDVLVFVDFLASCIARVRAGYSSESDLKVWLEPLANDLPVPVCDGYRDVSSSLPYDGELVSAP